MGQLEAAGAAQLEAAGACGDVEAEMRRWRTAAIALGVALALVAVGGGIALVRHKLLQIARAGAASGADAAKPWLVAMEEGEGDFSDSISDTSSLFSPPFRANDGVVFKPAAANISDTQAYLMPSVSTEHFDRLYDDELGAVEGLEGLEEPAARPKVPPSDASAAGCRAPS